MKALGATQLNPTRVEGPVGFPEACAAGFFLAGQLKEGTHEGGTHCRVGPTRHNGCMGQPGRSSGGGVQVPRLEQRCPGPSSSASRAWLSQGDSFPHLLHCLH